MKKFSLIEVLVVVAIIGILASLLLPSLSSARKAAKQAVCKSNQKNIYIGYLNFSEDGYEEFTDSLEKHNHKSGQMVGLWTINQRISQNGMGLDNYADMNCPAFTDTDTIGTKYPSYGFNQEDPNGTKASWGTRLNLTDINIPSQMVLMGCRERLTNWGGLSNQFPLATYHPKSQGNISCFDGHVESASPYLLANPFNTPSLLNEP